jgi:hypothetical protein
VQKKRSRRKAQPSLWCVSGRGGERLEFSEKGFNAEITQGAENTKSAKELRQGGAANMEYDTIIVKRWQYIFTC